MTVTVSWSLMNSAVIRLSTALVRATFVEFECHCGNEMRRPELSKLTTVGIRHSCRAQCGRSEESLPVLAARSAVEINNNLETVVPRPGDGLLQIGQLARDERLSRADVEGPVADGDADVV